MRDVNGDSGYLVNLEVRTRPVSLGLGRRNCDQLQLLAFHDIGGAMNRRLLPGEPWHVALYGAGLGMRYSLGQNVSLRCDYAWQVDRLAGKALSSRPHIGLVIAR